MRSLLIEALCRSAYHSGLLTLVMGLAEPRGRTAPGGRFQILVYHRVSDVTDAFVAAAPIAVFADHMRYLRRHFRILPLDDLVAAAERHEVPARAIAITLDDGYEDAYTNAYPILRRFDIPATVYLATGLIDRNETMWNDRVGVAIRDTTNAVLDAVPGCSPLPLTTPAQKQHAFGRALAALKRRPPVERAGLTAQIERALHITADGAPRMLRWRQIQEMSAAGIDFGAHTVNHPILAAIPAADARREIVESKQVIEERLQKSVRHFAYPNGRAEDFTAETKGIVREAGFASASSTIFDTNTTATDLYELRRCGPTAAPPALFVAKLWWYRQTGSAAA